jgi:DNA-binding NarL/FixJ family response regulator
MTQTALNWPVTRQESLTKRESQVAFWIAQGKTNREIAIILTVRPRTIEKHVENVLRKLHVENRTTAALLLVHRSGENA